MKKIVSVIFVLMLCSVCFCKEISSTFLGNLDTDNVAKFQVRTFAIATCQDMTKGKGAYEFKRVDNDNLGAYLLSKDCMDDVYAKFSISNGDLYRSIYQLTDSVIAVMFLFKTHESPLAWRYYCYTITFQEEN
jgi:hypothetical protein